MFFLLSPSLEPIEYSFQLKESTRKVKRAKEHHGKDAMQWEYIYPGLGPLAAVALIVPVPSVTYE